MDTDVYLYEKTQEHLADDAVAVNDARLRILFCPDEKPEVVLELRRTVCRNFVRHDPDNLRRVRKIILQRNLR